MGLRPGHCYCPKVKKRAYSRVAVTVHKKNYIGGVPGLKIRQFHMGNGNGTYSHVVHFVTKNKVQIRDNAIEAVRQSVVRQLNKKLTAENYYMKIRVYPQFFLRENKQAQGAHADRIQTGMSQCPFGKVVGRAARVRKNQKIISVLVNEANVKFVKELFERMGSKLPTEMKVIVEKNIDNLKSVGTVKKKRQLKEEEEVVETQKTEATVATAPVTGKDGKTTTTPATPQAGKEAKGAGATGKEAKGAGATGKKK